MLTANIDISDRLINGQINTVVKLQMSIQTLKRRSILFIKVDDDKAGQNMINNSNNQYAKENKVTISAILANIKVRPYKPSSPAEIQSTQFPTTLYLKIKPMKLDTFLRTFISTKYNF